VFGETGLQLVGLLDSVNDDDHVAVGVSQIKRYG
jgi:hypothetical protein